MAYRTIEEFHVGSAFQFPPASLTVRLPQALALADGFAGRDQFHILDASDNLEVHSSAPLRQKRRARAPSPHKQNLAAAAGAAAAHASVATAVAGHDAAAEAAAGGVA